MGGSCLFGKNGEKKNAGKSLKKVNKNPAILEWVGSEDKARFLLPINNRYIFHNTERSNL